MVNPGKVRKRILYIPAAMRGIGDATAIHSHYRRALGSRAPSVAMLDDGGGAQAAALVRTALRRCAMVLLGCIRAGRCCCSVDYYTTVPEKVGFHRNLA